MIQDPADGETASDGEQLVYHEGVGEPPETGYFMEHEPGEVAEFHLFVPDNLKRDRKYPLLIVYHGGKDGASGKGLLANMSKVSTKEHPVIVLSPNMYTLDAYHELLEAGELPIDSRRVVVYGFSSGGMGILSAIREFLRTDGAFQPATLITASTTATTGGRTYPQVPLVVMAGEKETPEFVKNKILRERRQTCRRYSVALQAVVQEVRYIEMAGYGHTSGKPEYHAVIRNLIRALPEHQVKLKLSRTPQALLPLANAARAGDWGAVRAEFASIDAQEDFEAKNSYATLRGRILRALESSLKEDVKFITRLGTKSETWEVLRAFALEDELRDTLELFADTPSGEKLARLTGSLDRSKSWQAQLDARARYLAIVGETPSEEMVEELRALLDESPKTEYGGNRTREKLLALED